MSRARTHACSENFIKSLPGEIVCQGANQEHNHIADDANADLTPSPSNFPFNIAGEYMVGGQPVQLTLEQLSLELQNKVSDIAKEMENL